MTEQLKFAGITLATFVEKHFAAILSAIFAIGFIWAQFDGVRLQLHETREQLRTLVSQVNADRSEIAADHRDLERLMTEVAFLRERIIAQRADLRRVELRLISFEASDAVRREREGRIHVESP